MDVPPTEDEIKTLRRLPVTLKADYDQACAMFPERKTTPYDELTDNQKVIHLREWRRYQAEMHEFGNKLRTGTAISIIIGDQDHG